MRTSNLIISAQAGSPWPMRERTPMALSSSSQPQRQPGSMVDMSCSAK
ncbi:UNVERIFIED_CONTAM: hypothetical protein GTU68_041052 [Idotea baltica]|nr:hypothetical protein [Idotea baltica]